MAASYVAFQGLEIHGGRSHNIHVAPFSASITNIILNRLKVHSPITGTAAAIKINRNNPNGVGVERVYIENSELAHSINNAVVDGVGVRTAVVRNNYIHDPAVGMSGMFFKGGSSQILIEKNLIEGVRNTSALLLGGDSGAPYFDPQSPNQEGVDQTVRNNFIADANDSIVEIRGVRRGKVYHNTFVTQSAFTVFRLMNGRNASGGVSYNSELEITNNLVINVGTDTQQYIRNDGVSGSLKLGKQIWVGSFVYYPTTGIPSFPRTLDINLAKSAAPSTLVNPTYASLISLADAKDRYRLALGSLAKSNGDANTVVPKDVIDIVRSTTKPSLGAYE